MKHRKRKFGLTTLLGRKAALLGAPLPLEEAISIHGDPRRFTAFADIPQVSSASAVMDAWDGRFGTARAWSSSNSKPFELFATREQLRPLYNAGFNLVFEDVESFVPQLRPLCRALERDLNVAPGRVNVQAFCGRKGGRGRAHFDLIRGRKLGQSNA